MRLPFRFLALDGRLKPVLNLHFAAKARKLGAGVERKWETGRTPKGFPKAGRGVAVGKRDRNRVLLSQMDALIIFFWGGEGSEDSIYLRTAVITRAVARRAKEYKAASNPLGRGVEG